MTYRRIVMAALAIVFVVGAAGVLTGFRRQAVAGTTGGIDPAAFTNPVPNPYFPLKVGTVSRYLGSDGPQKLREQVTVTHWTKKIQGVTTTVIFDVLHRADDGSLAEKTWDWYADDNAGNVWYFGERTATYTRSGHVSSREGTWQAGVNGAVAGTIMPANPHPTDAYRQEFDKRRGSGLGPFVKALSTRASSTPPSKRQRRCLHSRATPTRSSLSSRG